MRNLPCVTWRLVNSYQWKKSKHRVGGGSGPHAKEKPDFYLGKLINEAIAKKPKYPLVIFVDTNLPFKWAERTWVGKQATAHPVPCETP